MGINTDLNISPYFDDYSVENQFNRILFRPARALQARELTQIQSILQNQIGDMASNLFKEGTVINGVNYSEEVLSFVKISDNSPDFNETDYLPTEDGSYYLEDSNGLRAEIVLAEDGFESQSPNLKTFYIHYLNTIGDAKTFAAGSTLTILDPDMMDSGFSVTVTELSDHVGNTFSVKISDGVIYDKSHFVYVAPQRVIVEKYSRTPGTASDVSVGFTIYEDLVTASDVDPSLYDNAQGFNNFGAPGADRLRLRPVLESYPTNNEPDNFFRIIKYENGRATQIRDVTQFNSIADFAARRTYEESGDYIVSGLTCSMSQQANNVVVSVEPGRAYVKGYGVDNLVKRNLILEPLTETANTTSQSSGMQYGQYFVYTELSSVFELDGTRYNLYKDDDTLIGSCAVRNVESGKLYVYDLVKKAAEKTTDIAKIGPSIANATTVTGGLKGVSKAPSIFPIGKNGGMKSVTNITMTKRTKETFSQSSANSINIPAPTTGGDSIYISGDFVVFDSVSGNSVSVSSVADAGGGAVTVNLGSSVTDGTVYYDLVTSTGTTPDTKTAKEIWVISNLTSGKASLGVPDALEILEVYDYTGSSQGDDITTSFILHNGQKDTHYDLAHISLKVGENLSSVDKVLVKVKVFERTSLSGSGLLTVDSYPDDEIENIPLFASSFGIEYELRNCYDFRPQVEPTVAYATSVGSAETAPDYADLVNDVETKVISADNVPSNNALMISNQEIYLRRKDVVTLSSTGELSIVKGTPASIPSVPKVVDDFVLAEITHKSDITKITGPFAIQIQNSGYKGYTMRDIQKIDKRTEILADAVSLSLLEKNTADLLILDESGDPRFKNGILVDPFKNMKVSAIDDPEFKASLDKTRKIMSPAVTQFNIDLVPNTSDSNTFQNVDFFDDVATVGTSGQVNFIEQPYASNLRNAASNFYLFRGSGIIDPAYDSGYDVISQPNAVIDIDIESPLTSLVENIQEFLPLSTTSSETVAQSSVTETVGDWQTTTTTFTDLNINRQLSSSATQSQSVVGEFVTDISFQPYIQGQDIRIIINGLRPNARHYVYFDKTDINYNVRPAIGSGTFNSIIPTGNRGDALTSDGNGTLYAILTIPDSTYFVGKRNIEVSDAAQYVDISSAGTSYSKMEFNAYNFDVSKQNLVTNTRSAEFFIDEVQTVTTRSVTDRVNIAPPPEPEIELEDLFEDRGEGEVGGANQEDNDPQHAADPLAQTFFVKKSMTNNTGYLYISSIDLYFQKKSATRGVTVELREVLNGYPSAAVLPFGKVHVPNSDISVSDNALVATNVQFSNPVKVASEREYAFVIIPDANDPDFILWTAKVGGIDTLGRSITQDWGDGVLFTSTNNKAWKSYQDEDVRFALYRYSFDAETESYLELRPADYEFLTVENVGGRFQRGEIVYQDSGTTYATSSLANNVVTISGSTTLSKNDYVKLTQGADVVVNKIVSDVSYNSGANTTTFSIGETPDISGALDTTELVVGGIVDHHNPRKKSRLLIKNSSARVGNVFTSNTLITGTQSDASADVVSIDDIEISYIQPIIYENNVTKTSTSMMLYDGAAPDRSIAPNTDAYLQRNLRTVDSKSNYIDGSDQTFLIKYNLNTRNNINTPILDHKISGMFLYQYHLLDEANEAESSAYITSKVRLQDDIDATGLTVILDGHRPNGSDIKVYGRFVYKYNEAEYSDWIELVNQSPDLYTTTLDERDFREFRYVLEEGLTPDEYIAFQVKVSFVADEINLGPAIRNFRAIGVT
jgi:hypothetical protein